MLFTQLGVRAPDGRATTNIGLGVRTFYITDWMLGANVFFDDDITGKNRRVGVGTEAWTNNLKISANTYFGTTQWHQSRDLDDYNEKPADGYDLRLEGYLPALPQLGAKVMYEQYYGDNVALFDTDHLQRDPSAISTGLNYTPIPLLQFGVDYKRGQDSLDDTQFTLTLRYDISLPWAAQIDPDNVSQIRTLAGSRNDLVERNNQIILQYQKKQNEGVQKLVLQTLTDNAPADGLTSNTLQAYAMDRDNQPVANAPIAWALAGDATADTPSSVTNSQGLATINLTSTTPSTVQVTAKSGSVSATQDSHFNAVQVSHIELHIDKDASVADGRSANSGIATVTDINNRPIANATVLWKVSAPAMLQNAQTKTDNKGQVRTEFVSTQAGTVTLSVTADTVSAEQPGTFVANSQNAQIVDFSVVINNSPADGKTPDNAIVVVKDNYGNPVNGAHVTLSADKTTVNFVGVKRGQKNADSTTDEKGQLAVQFTDTRAETVTLKAQLDNGNNKSVNAQFAANTSSAEIRSLDIVKNGSVADGTTANEAQVFVKDAGGNPIKGMTVNWRADRNSVQLPTASVTDDNGETVIKFTDTVAETVALTASLANGSQKTAQGQFRANPATALLVELTVTKNGSVANNVDTNVARVYVKDEYGNPLEGANVAWSADKDGVTFQPGGASDTSGKTTVTFTSKVAQPLQITARLSNGQEASAPALFIADASSEQISDFTVTSGAVADNTATNSATVEVLDAEHNPVPNTTVRWSISGSATLAADRGVTDKDGRLRVTFKDALAETVNVKATLDNGASQTKPSTFIANGATAQIVDYRVTTGALADGEATNVAIVMVADANNNAIKDAEITWTVNGAASLSASTGQTDDKGKASVTFTDKKAETVQITASLKGGNSLTKDSGFIASTKTAHIVSLTNDVTGSLADGSATNRMNAVVKDENNNPVSGEEIHWRSNSSTVRFLPTDKTDDAGKTTVSFTDTVAETLTITGKLDNGDEKTQSSRFVVDEASAAITDMVVMPDNQRADGEQSDVVTVTVKDKMGNVLQNQQVAWSASRQSVSMTPSGATDEKGQATVTLKDTVGGKVDVTATLINGNTQTRTAHFLTINVATLTSDITRASANNSDVITLTATVKDANGSAVSGTPVTFKTTGQATLSAGQVRTNLAGQAIVTLKDGVEEDVTVTASADINAADTGKTQQVTFVARKISQISAGGMTFSVETHFPTVGFYGATFQPLVDGDAKYNSEYTWSVNQNWLFLDTETGTMSMKGSGATSDNKTVVVTGTPKKGGQPISYTFTLNYWVVSEGRNSSDPADADSLCPSRGRQVPPPSLLSNGAPGSYGTRSVGTLWGEWGDLSQYPDWSHAGYTESMWTTDTGKNGSRIYVSWRNGYVNEKPLPEESYGVDIVCKRDL